MKEILKYSVALLLFLLLTKTTIGQKFEISYYVDTVSKYSIKDQEKFYWKVIAPNEQFTFGYNDNTSVWCKLTVHDWQNVDLVYWSFNSPHLDSIDLYENEVFVRRLGDRTEEQSPFLQALAFKLDHTEASPKIFIARVKKQWSFIDFSTTVERHEKLSHLTNRSISFAFIILGFAFMLTLFNLYIYFQTRGKRYFYYAIYSLIGIVYVLVNTGVAKFSLLPNFLHFSEMRIYSGCFWFLMLGVFLSEILDFKLKNRLVYRAIMFFQWCVFVLSFVSVYLLVANYQELIFFSSSIVYFLFLVNIILLGIGVGSALRDRHKWSLFVLISFVPHICWGLNMIFLSFDIFKVKLSIDWISAIILYEMILFGWVLIKDYVDAFKRSQKLQLLLIEEERNAMLSIEAARLKERRVVADILHDKIGIDIAHTSHLLEMDLKEEARLALMKLGSDIRDLSHTILPKALLDGVLPAAVSDQLEIIRSQNPNVLIQFNTYDFPSNIHPDMAFGLYLISIEIIQNSIKHGGSTEVNVNYFGYSDELVLTFADNGCGFDGTSQLGFGLRNVKRRIADFGGTFELDAKLNMGVEVLISISI